MRPMSFKRRNTDQQRGLGRWQSGERDFYLQLQLKVNGVRQNSEARDEMKRERRERGTTDLCCVVAGERQVLGSG